ncbi:hypothetical protein H310_12638 [Aphanomyces invadans]|uniref:Shikimate kinase n=1 Tax=Aphanomyces invadans TaxID=157072 RepID=A0A024TIG7_9STRA|nr:hypothetical protein H310_12638 [Aphanomyces invadans]ETV93376.1 hypothetical protein H310_12638 [Aphanomyces invadans]|eukprot:XP_008878012.1 hypothetical protein H310_12638 [Aphanomyces invadans]
MDSTALEGPVLVYLVGWPGTGKQTIGHAMQRLVPTCHFFSNHHVIDLAKAIAGPRGSASPSYQRIRGDVHANAVDLLLSQLRATNAPAIMTGAHAGGAGDVGVFGNVYAAATHAGIPVVGVLLRCSLEENKRRVATDERQGRKLTNPDDLDTIYATKTLFDAVPHPIDLDVTQMSPDEAAHCIWTHVRHVRNNLP